MVIIMMMMMMMMMIRMVVIYMGLSSTLASLAVAELAFLACALAAFARVDFALGLASKVSALLCIF